MALWDRVTAAMALAPWDHPRVELSFPSVEAQLEAARLERQMRVRPWRPASIAEALGVPAIFGAVKLISNTVGLFTLMGYRNGRRVPDEERPPLIVRPNPLTTPRDYLRETAWSMATRGENWQWVGARDTDNKALSLIPVPSYEVKVEGDWLKPSITWRGADKTHDMAPVFLTKELGDLRGKGPLQYCGAAISAAVESQQWAANHFAEGGHPSVVMHSEAELTQDEAVALREQWMETPPNMPQVTSGGINITEYGKNADATQMLSARDFNAGEAARMFTIPGALLEYGRTGSSLTYTTVVSLMDQFVRSSLIPDYLEPLEQMLSDQLPRTWTARFNVDEILRADIKTRFQVYESAITKSGVLSVEEARSMEGLEPGIETAPVPLAPPSALPASIPTRTFSEFRCSSCNRKLADERGQGTRITCRCGTRNVA